MKVEVTLKLNGEEGALVLAALMSTRDMINEALQRAINDGKLKVAQLTREQLAFFDKMTQSLIIHRTYESDSFEVTPEEVLAHLQRAKEAVDEINDDDEDGATKELKDAMNSSDGTVVSIFDKLKKADEDHE